MALAMMALRCLFKKMGERHPTAGRLPVLFLVTPRFTS